MWKSEKQIWNELQEEVNRIRKVEKEKMKWWNSLDMNDKYLSKLWFSMFGTTEQRISQLFIIRHSQNFKLKTQ